MRSVKDECLSRIIPFAEGHLRRIIGEYLLHDNHERDHHGIGNGRIDAEVVAGAGHTECKQRVGGLLEFYRRAGCSRPRSEPAQQDMPRAPLAWESAASWDALCRSQARSVSGTTRIGLVACLRAA